MPVNPLYISIHALLAESDPPMPFWRTPPSNFYPRSPCGERPIVVLRLVLAHVISIHALLAESDGCKVSRMDGARSFLSTLSLRRATRLEIPAVRDLGISIHALLAESDHLRSPLPPPFTHFYPRSPCGERPCYNGVRKGGENISIHALLAESDQRQCWNLP